MNNRKKKIRIFVDIAMPILLITIMGYQLIGRAYHEYAGIAMFILFIIHNYLNIKWYKVLFKGKYTPYRILSTFINISILIIMILLMVSGIIMSEYAFKFLNLNFGNSISRLIHLSLSYWEYILMSFHLGMHLGQIINKNRKYIFVIIVVALYGVYTFLTRKIWSYMLLINKFAFFDTDENIFKFIIDYTAIMILFAMLGYYISSILKKSKA